MSGLSGCFDAGAFQDAVLAVLVLEVYVEVLPERLHIGVVVKAVTHHPLRGDMELIDAQQQEQRQDQPIAVFPTPEAIEPQSDRGQYQQPNRETPVSNLAPGQGPFAAEHNSEQVQDDETTGDDEGPVQSFNHL